MHIAVVGAGSLGRVFGVRLAAAGTDVSFVVRPGREGDGRPITVEQINGKRKDTLENPRRVSAIPPEATAVVVAVRFDQLGPEGDVAKLLAPVRSAPIVVLTPLLPAQLSALEGSVGRRLVAGMPGVVGYIDDRDVVRYWVTHVAATLFDDPGPRREEERSTVEEVARRLGKVGLPARLEQNVGSTNAATTLSFFPLIAAIDTGAGIDGVLANKELLHTTLEAAKETDELARKLGKPASWAHLLTKFAGPLTVKPGVALGRRLVPETVLFVERHFGAKLHDQHLSMGEAILSIGRQVGSPLPALERLLQIVRERGG